MKTLTWSGFFGLTAVMAGAFGAHALADKLTAHDLDIFQTAARYQIYHALALGLVALLQNQAPESKSLNWSANFFAAGIVIFSGSLYLLVLTQTRWLGAITPLGGLSLMTGWGCLMAYARSAKT